MNNEDILNKYKKYLRQKYTSKNTLTTYINPVKLFLNEINKPFKDITLDEYEDWKIKCLNLNQNTARGYMNSVNKFYGWLKDENYINETFKLPLPKQKRPVKKPLSKDEWSKFLSSSKEDPLDYLLTLLLFDAALRPSTINGIKISNIDFENRKIYIDKDKTDKQEEKPVLMSPRLMDSILEYLKYRPKPDKIKDNDYLIITNHRRWGKTRVKSTKLALDHIKKIAIRAGLKRTITPYKTIRPSAAKLRFDDGVNPRVIQRIFRHTDIKTTLNYDHSNDKDALDYLSKQDTIEIDRSKLTPKQHIENLIQKYLNNEIDQKTFDTMIEFLKPENTPKKHEMDGYV